MLHHSKKGCLRQNQRMRNGLITIAFGIVLAIPWLVRRKADSLGPLPEDHYAVVRRKAQDVAAKIGLGLGVGLVALGAVRRGGHRDEVPAVGEVVRVRAPAFRRPSPGPGLVGVLERHHVVDVQSARDGDDVAGVGIAPP